MAEATYFEEVLTHHPEEDVLPSSDPDYSDLEPFQEVSLLGMPETAHPFGVLGPWDVYSEWTSMEGMDEESQVSYSAAIYDVRVAS